MSTVFSGAMTIHISGLLPLLSMFVSIFLAELKTDWKWKHDVCVSTAPNTVESQSQFGLSRTTRMCTRIINKN